MKEKYIQILFNDSSDDGASPDKDSGKTINWGQRIPQKPPEGEPQIRGQRVPPPPTQEPESPGQRVPPPPQNDK